MSKLIDADDFFVQPSMNSVKHGRWICCGYPICSECGEDPTQFFHTEGEDYSEVVMNYLSDLPKYCPNCGTKMDKE